MANRAQIIQYIQARWYQNSNKEISGTNTRAVGEFMATHLATVEELTAAVGTINGRLVPLETAETDLSGEIDAINLAIGQIQTNVTNLQNTVNAFVVPLVNQINDLAGTEVIETQIGDKLIGFTAIAKATGSLTVVEVARGDSETQEDEVVSTRDYSVTVGEQINITNFAGISTAEGNRYYKIVTSGVAIDLIYEVIEGYYNN